ncbi:MAG: DUF885 domain-containing protein [Candidatus Rokubacteria bacterium]|nr:DUF885 domain-containing protein [Candidatus Rokubacteria bacterium]
MPSFAELAAAFLAEEYADSPVRASHLGVDGYDDRLDDLSEAAFAARRRRSAEWLARFEAVPDDGLGVEARIDRDLLRSVLRGRAIMADWEMWRRQPDTYLGPGLDGVFILFLHRRHPEPELARAAAARLRAVPGCLAAGERNLQPELSPAVYVERALGQARAGVRYTRELVPGEVADPRLRGELAEAGAVAASAYERFAAFLERLRDKASGAWAIGEARYTRLLREKELLPYDARGLRERGCREYERLAGELRGYARTIAGTDDWARVLEELSADHPPTPEAMLAAYAEWTERARAFLRERALVTLPDGEECVVRPSPPFQRPVLAVASYQSPPAFSPSLRGHFFVPFPPDGASPEEVQKRLSNNSHATIPDTAVHEAYPGHHWHLVTMKRHPSAVRRTFRTPYFTEGWALYAEQLMREQGFFRDPRQEMSQVEAALFRAARIVVDTSLHLGEMGFDEAVAFMRAKANLPEPTARAEVARYCSWPTQAAAYLTGCLEILALRERYVERRGRSDVATLRVFHDALAGSGGLPIALAERALFG